MVKKFKTSKRYRVLVRVTLVITLISVLGIAWFYRGIYSMVLLIAAAYATYSYINEFNEVIVNGEELTLKSRLRMAKMPLSDIKKAIIVRGRAGNVILIYTQRGKFSVPILSDYEDLMSILNRNATASN